jgi:hypothetical protein
VGLTGTLGNWLPSAVAVFWSTILPALIGAVVAFLLALANQWISDRRTYRRRWDRDVFDVVSELIRTARALMHLATPEAAAPDRDEKIRSTLGDVRIATGRVLLVANPSLSEAAVDLQSALYRLATESLEPDGEERWREPYDAVYAQISSLVAATRGQLDLEPISRVHNA